MDSSIIETARIYSATAVKTLSVSLGAAALGLKTHRLGSSVVHLPLGPVKGQCHRAPKFKILGGGGLFDPKSKKVALKLKKIQKVIWCAVARGASFCA